MRKLLLVVLALGLVLANLLLVLLMPRHCPVNRAAFERLKVGMAKSEVEKILGGPSGDYRTLPYEEFDLARFTELSLPAWPEELWIGDMGDVSVGFMPGDIVAEVRFDEAEPCAHTLIDIATWRLKQLKDRLLP